MITGQASNGLRYAASRSGSAVGYCALSIRCGTRDEAGFPAGIAHFTEHTLFKGTARKSASVINSYLDKLGGELNAYTTKEEIVLHATVLKEDLRKAAGLLLEIATTATFPDKEVETERGVVLDEIMSYKDSPADDVYDRFEERLFAGHPLSGLILGTKESVSSITSSDLRRFVREKFRPEVMALTIVADLDEKKMEQEILKLAGKYFPEPQPCRTPVERPLHPEFDPKKFDETVDGDNHEVNAVIGSTAPSLYEESDRMTAILLANILGGPASNSILNEVLRERHGWVYAVEASYTQYADTGIMAICLGCDKSNLEKCCTAIHKEVLKLQTIPLSVRRLKAAKKQLLGQLAISSDNGESQCLSMGKSLISFGKIEPRGEIRRKIEAIQAEDLRRMACRIFHPDRLSRLIFT